MQDVARAAGVHQTTVSRALRNDPRLPQGTRRRLQRLAEKLGYRPHPLVSALIALRRTRHPPRLDLTIAFVARSALGESGQQHFDGARVMAEQLGYRVELFVLGTGNLTEKRLSSVLLARNIRGVIIAALPEAQGQFELEWERFCTVVIEYTFVTPAFDRVVHDSYDGMRMILRECRRREIRRVGLALTRVAHERTQRLNGAAYWMEQKSDRFFAAIPPLVLVAWDADVFHAWQRRHRLEAVVTSNAFLPQLKAWCAHHRLRPGRDLQIINVNANPHDPVSGVFQNHVAIGATAARMIVEKIVRNDTGIPTPRHTTLTPGTWFEGATLSPAQAVRLKSPAAS
jgi:LacI family transcriptional regulator/LacI family fructose operon transcriptional repressor